MVATSLVCLALTIWTESRGEPLQGQIAVASVVMNRVETGNSTVCGEVTKPSQFPWAKNKIRKHANDYIIYAKALPQGKTWDHAIKVASEVLEGSQKLVPHIAYFHNVHEHPKWKLKREFALGRHIFYSNKKHTPETKLSSL